MHSYWTSLAFGHSILSLVLSFRARTARNVSVRLVVLPGATELYIAKLAAPTLEAIMAKLNVALVHYVSFSINYRRVTTVSVRHTPRLNLLVGFIVFLI